MNAKLIASVPASTTFENATSTTYHFFAVEGEVYRVETNCREVFPAVTPLSLVKCELADVVIPEGDLLSRLGALRSA
jgi:hypothetical protein